MGSRILKESICTSDNLDKLSWFEEVLFYRLIVNCDDFGRMDARPPILRSRLFPLKTITDTQIAKALQSLRSAAMIDLYEVDGRSYLQMRTWEKHQQVRAKRAKYPEPKETDLISNEIICNQMKSNEIICMPNPIQSESVSESNPNTKGKRTRFVPPTQEEASAFFAQNGGTEIQAQEFYNYFTSNGWLVGKAKAPMKDWNASARGWILRDKKNGFTAGQSKPLAHDPHMQRYTPEERKATWSAAVVDFDA